MTAAFRNEINTFKMIYMMMHQKIVLLLYCLHLKFSSHFTSSFYSQISTQSLNAMFAAASERSLEEIFIYRLSLFVLMKSSCYMYVSMVAMDTSFTCKLRILYS